MELSENLGVSMEEYITIKNANYEIRFPKRLERYIEEVLAYSTTKLKEYLQFFNEDSYGSIIKVSFLLTREDFIKRLKEVAFSNAHILPNWSQWAEGSFCGNEVQILLEEENPYKRFYTLAHETFHLLFIKFIYEKNNWNRIIWLDESLAGNFDGTTADLIKHNIFPNIISRYVNTPNLPCMNEIDLTTNVRTSAYNAYELFKIVGRYLIETKTPNELFDYINNIEAITKDSKTILEESLTYFSKQYQLHPRILRKSEPNS